MRIIGHRGARREAPENTLGGFQYIKNLGIRGVEFDIRQLQDQELVVIHDDNFLRTAGVDQIVEHSTLAQALSFDHRQNWPNWPTSEPTPIVKLLYYSYKIRKKLEITHRLSRST
ncbi:glycerophosphodiester phosphodiesterase family protein, partial [Acinetobacter baumannii]